MLDGFTEDVPRTLLTICPNVKGWGKDMYSIGGYSYYPITYQYKNGLIAVKSPKPARGINWDLKALGGKWNPGTGDSKFNFQCWVLNDNAHTEFQLRYLIKDYPNPYDDYKINYPVTLRSDILLDHQKQLASDIYSHRGAIGAYDMGTGKTLSWITATEQLVLDGKLADSIDDIWYIGPVAGVKAVTRELRKWNACFTPRMLTYNGLTKIIKEWTKGDLPPRMVCFDESSCLKNAHSQRSIAARKLADSMRNELDDFRIVELSGTPSPKAPDDWFNQFETAEPGFILEGNQAKFRARLCLSEQKEGPYGKYPEIIAWLDDENRCKHCGQYQEHDNHHFNESTLQQKCTFEKSINEVAKLFKRAKGLVRVALKEDCLDLPPKQYIEEEIMPTPAMLRAAKLIKATSERVVTALCLMRELSDGFAYTQEVIGQTTCPECFGEGVTEQPMPVDEIDSAAPQVEFNYTYEECECYYCGGKGEVPVYKKSMDVCGSPKDQILVEDLEQCEDIGRICIWAGFTGTIDRLTDLVRGQGWAVLKIDGRGLVGIDPEGNPLDVDDLLDAMDASHPMRKKLHRDIPKLAVIAHPKAAGMAYTFTTARMAIYYSNVFDGEARMQSEDRIHRVGMDSNTACIIKDYLLLPTDTLVLDNLKKKKKLQNLTMNRINDAFVD